MHALGLVRIQNKIQLKFEQQHSPVLVSSLWYFIALMILFGCVYLRVDKYLMSLFFVEISDSFNYLSEF